MRRQRSLSQAGNRSDPARARAAHALMQIRRVGKAKRAHRAKRETTTICVGGHGAKNAFAHPTIEPNLRFEFRSTARESKGAGDGRRSAFATGPRSCKS